MDILYLDYPLGKAAFCCHGGVWFNFDVPDKLTHSEVVADCTMDFSLWLKYYSQTKL